MPIDWDRFGAELKRWRERRGMTQDLLAAKVGVRWNTIARLEIGNRRPSLDMLERVAKVLQCRIRDLLPEEKDQADPQRGPILRGAPLNFRAAVKRAQSRSVDFVKITIGSHRPQIFYYQDEYWVPGRTLGLQLQYYLDAGAIGDPQRIAWSGYPREFFEELLAFLDREFPGCMALIPVERRDDFMRGFLRAIAGYSYPFDFDFSLEGMSEQERKEAERFTRPWTGGKRFPDAFLEAVRKCLQWQEKTATAKRSTGARKWLTQDYARGRRKK